MKSFALPCACALALLACKKDPLPSTVCSAPESFKETLGRVLEKYLIVQGGLADSNQVLAKNAMGAMHGDLHGLTAEGLDPAAAAHFDSVDAAIMVVLHDTAFANGGVDVVRRLFRDFTPLLA